MMGRTGFTMSLAIAGLLASADAARGQRSDSLLTGVRYRVTLPEFPNRPGHQPREERHLAGELVARRADSLVLRPHPLTGEVAVPLAAVTRLERSRGVSRAASAIEGAIGGAFVSGLAGWGLYERDLRGPGYNTRGQAIGTSAAIGAATGLLVGLLFPMEKWRRVDVPAPR
jgi:hypothetical protein